MHTLVCRILLPVLIAGSIAAAPDAAPFSPRKFTFKSPSATLGAVLDELAKQTGVEVGRSKAESDRSLRIECQATPFWEALERIAKESDHRIVFSADGKRPQLVGGGEVTYREIPVSVDRVFRVSVRQVQSTLSLDRDASVTEVDLQLYWEPGYHVFLVDEPGKAARARDNTGLDLQVDDAGSGRRAVAGGGVQLPVRLVGVPRSARTIQTLEGKLGVIAATKMLDFKFEKPGDAKGTDKTVELKQEEVKVRLRTDFAANSDLWSARVEFEYPPGGPQFESFESAAWLIENQAWLESKDGKVKMEYNGGYEVVGESDRRAVIIYRFTDDAVRKLGKPEDWSFVVRTPAKLLTTDVKFKLENIPLP